MYRLRTTEHGEPIYDDAQGIYKKLRMAVDQMVVHRAQIQPDRYMVKIDTGDMPPNEQYQTVQRWKQSFRSNLSFGGKTTNTPEEFKSFYNAMSLDSVLWLPVPAGRSHSIEKLAGTTTIPDVYDIELLENLFFSILGMPKAYIKGPKDGQNPPSAKSLLAQDMRFLRRVKALRKPVIERYQWLGYFHAILRGLDPSKLDIKAKMSPIGGLEDAQRVETLKGQIEILTALGEVMTNFNLPRETWIEIIFKRYMHLPDDIVAVFLTALPMPSAGNQEESSMTHDEAEKLLVEAVEKDTRLKDGLASLAAFAMGKNAEKEDRGSPYKTAEDVLGLKKNRNNSLVESTDRIAFMVNDQMEPVTSSNLSEDTGTPYYRKVIDGRKR
jgi:hypothetical protein